jgi:hypothetical protein
MTADTPPMMSGAVNGSDDNDVLVVREVAPRSELSLLRVSPLRACNRDAVPHSHREAYRKLSRQPLSLPA